jgi:RHS repeat-associated protein
VTKTQGSYSATYEYNYGDKLVEVTSDFPGEGDVSYAYRGDGKRESRTYSGSTTEYHYNAGWNVIAEHDGSDVLQRTYIYDGPLSSVGQFSHCSEAKRLPGGHWSAAKRREGFTGKPYDSQTGLYWFPYRYYSPAQARWLTRDPLGMVDGPNVYAYVVGNPVGRVDPLGLATREEKFHWCNTICLGVGAVACASAPTGPPASVPIILYMVICAVGCPILAEDWPSGGCRRNCMKRCISSPNISGRGSTVRVCSRRCRKLGSPSSPIPDELPPWYELAP